QNGFLLGESKDSGKTWKFVDGAGLLKDRESLKAFFPNLPSDLKLPEVGPLTFEKINTAVPINEADQKAALKVLQAQADQFGQAMLEVDYKRMVELMAPEALKALGGRDKVLKDGEALVAAMKSKGLKMTAVKSEVSSQLVGSSDAWYGIVIY